MLRRRLGELFGIDMRTLAVVRIGLALLILVDLVNRGQHLVAHYTDEGVLPRGALIEHLLPKWRFSLHLMNGEAGFQILLFGIAAGLAILLLLGYRTRLVAVFSWIMLASLQSRNPMVLQAGDSVLRMLLFWAMFLPLGAVWSLDAKVAGPSTARIPKRAISAASVALLLQLVFVYEFTVVLKNDPSWFRDFTAVYYALSIDHFVTPLGVYIRQFPELMKMLTMATLVVEIGCPILAFSPVANGPIRTAVIVSMIGFHLGLSLTLEIGLFSYIMMVGWLAFIPSWFWDKVGLSVRKMANAGPSWTSRTWVNVVVAACLSYVFMWNVRTTAFERVEPYFPKSINSIGDAVHITQYWNMFAPFPLLADGWYVIPGTLMSGAEVDLFRDGAPVTWDKPELVSAMYPNSRWRKYMMNLRRDDFSTQVINFGRYLCRRWNDTHTGDARLNTFRIYYMQEFTLPEGRTRPIEKIHLWRHYCFDKPADWDTEKPN